MHSLDAVSDQSLRGRPASVFSSIVAGSSSDGSRSRLSPAYRCRPAPTRCTAFPLGPVVDRLQDSSARIQRGGMRPPAPEQHLSPQLESTYCREFWCNQQRRSGDGSFLQVHTAVVLDVPAKRVHLAISLGCHLDRKLHLPSPPPGPCAPFGPPPLSPRMPPTWRVPPCWMVAEPRAWALRMEPVAMPSSHDSLRCMW